MDSSSQLSSLHSLGWKWSLLVFCSFHNAFSKATQHLLLDFTDFSVFSWQRVSEARKPKSQQGRFSGRVVRIRCKPAVMGTGERSLWDSRRKTSEVSGLRDQGFLFKSVREPSSSRLVDRRRTDGILRGMCYYWEWVLRRRKKKKSCPVSHQIVTNICRIA